MTKTVESDSVVKVHYIGSFPDTDEVFDTSREEIAKDKGVFNEERDYEPLPVEMGQQKVIPGFEQALLGMEVGERKTVEIPPEEAYGQPTDERVVDVPSDQFDQAEVEPQVGMMIQTSNGLATIVDFKKDENLVTLDFNHPLAGKTLEFDLEVINID